jgi:hypothetical protein
MLLCVLSFITNCREEALQTESFVAILCPKQCLVVGRSTAKRKLVALLCCNPWLVTERSLSRYSASLSLTAAERSSEKGKPWLLFCVLSFMTDCREEALQRESFVVILCLFPVRLREEALQIVNLGCYSVSCHS